MDLIPQLEQETDLRTYFSKLAALVRKNFSDEQFKSWLEQIGITSRINLKHVSSGRRPLNLKKFKSALNLSFSEETAFDSPTQIPQKTSAPLEYCLPEGFFRTPLNTIVLNLCGIQSIMTRQSVTQILEAAFSKESIKTAIDLLIAENLVAENDQGQLKRIFEGVLTTLPGIKSEASRKYFEETNTLASQSWHVPLELRETHAFTIRIDQKDLPRLKDLTRQYRAQCANLSEASSRDSVYQIAVTAFPIYVGS